MARMAVPGTHDYQQALSAILTYAAYVAIYGTQKDQTDDFQTSYCDVVIMACILLG